MYEALSVREENPGRKKARGNDTTVYSGSDREFLEGLIARSGVINRGIMRIYLGLDRRGLDRWNRYISRLRGRKKWFNLLSYWPLRALERLSAVYVGGSLTSREQETFGRICGVRAHILSRYNALVFGTWTGVVLVTSGELALWLSGFHSYLDSTLSLTSMLIYSFAVLSVGVDIWRVIDSFARERAHMPFGIFPLAINSTSFLKWLIESRRRAE